MKCLYLHMKEWNHKKCSCWFFVFTSSYWNIVWYWDYFILWTNKNFRSWWWWICNFFFISLIKLVCGQDIFSNYFVGLLTTTSLHQHMRWYCIVFTYVSIRGSTEQPSRALIDGALIRSLISLEKNLRKKSRQMCIVLFFSWLGFDPSRF